MKRLLSILFTINFSLLAFLYSLSTIDCSAQNHSQAIIDSLLGELPSQTEDTNKVRLLNELSRICIKINAEDGIKYGMAQLDLATKLGWEKGMALACNNLGNNYESKSDYPGALQYFSKALKLHKAIKYKKGMAAVTCNIGLVYVNLGDYPKALEYFFRALKIAEEGGYKSYAANITGNIGNIYETLGNYSKAQEYNIKALDLFKDLDFKMGIAGVTGNIGNIYLSQSDYSSALEYYFDALKLDEEGGFKQFSADVCNGIGLTYKRQKNYTMAIDYFQRSLNASEDVGNRASAALALFSIGDVLNEIVKSDKVGASSIGRQSEVGTGAYKPDGTSSMSKSELLKSASAYLLRALEMSKAVNAQSVIIQCYSALAETYKLKGDYKKALEASDYYHAMEDSVFSQENKEEILKMGMKNDYDRQRLTDSLKVAEKQKIATINLRKQKNYTYMGVAGIMLLAGFSFFIVKERGKSETARKQSDGLLLNILPDEVASELKATGTTTAKHYDDVTVLFTDFVNFTQASESMGAQNLIDELHACFKKFDEISEQYNIEKIKTIGDAYLAVAGLPTADPKHAENIVQAAKEITAFMEDRLGKMGAERTFQVRVGVHSGSVVAGIVGVKKFAYDIWGDTVNTAARMEQNSEAGKINISQTTYELVKDKFTCEYRGEFEAKGKGVMKMYYVSTETRA